jgi:hypothetical protein
VIDVGPDARSALASERTTDVTDLRRCIGSARFRIEAHDAPPEAFPVQPSQRDGLGRMCKTHWNRYTAGLARDAKARKPADGGPAAGILATEAAAPTRLTAKPEPKRTGSRRKVRDTAAPIAEVVQETTAG